MESYKICFLCLAPFVSIISSRFIRVTACVRIPFLLKVGCFSIVWTCCILFIPLSVNGHLRCFHLLALVSDAAVSTGILVSEYLFSIPLCIYLGMQLLDCMVILYLIFEALPNCFPLQLRCFTFPPTVHKSSNFFTS